MGDLMTEFVLKSSSERETQFTGELISEIDREIRLTDEDPRRIRLAVYAVEGGGFVSEARFESDHPNEPALSEHEDLDSFDDVDKFFYVFELYETLSNVHGLSRDERAESNCKVKRLVKEYQKILFPFLEETKEIVERRELQDRYKEPKKSRLWGIF